MCDRQSSFNGFMEFLLHLPFHHNHVDLLEIEQSLDQKRKKSERVGESLLYHAQHCQQAMPSHRPILASPHPRCMCPSPSHCLAHPCLSPTLVQSLHVPIPLAESCCLSHPCAVRSTSSPTSLVTFVIALAPPIALSVSRRRRCKKIAEVDRMEFLETMTRGFPEDCA